MNNTITNNKASLRKVNSKTNINQTLEVKKQPTDENDDYKDLTHNPNDDKNTLIQKNNSLRNLLIKASNKIDDLVI